MSISVAQILENLLLMGIAYLCALPVACNREVKSRSAGLRTFPLVAIGACGFMLMGTQSIEGDDATARILQGIIGGIGFLGGGAILKFKGFVKGTATAASLWATSAIGVAVALKQFEIAITISIMIFATLALLSPVKEKVEHQVEDDGKESKENE